VVWVASHKISRVPWYSRTGKELAPLVYETITLYGGPFHGPSTRVGLVTPRLIPDSVLPALQPPANIGSDAVRFSGFRLFPVRSPLLGELMSFYFPRGTEMFHFPHLPPTGLCVQPVVIPINRERVAPFGNPRLSLLDSSPRLFAVLPRPSSALDAKAFTVCP
jgi:hypothetical protein